MTIDRLIHKIKATPLTKIEKKIADHILENLDTVCFQTIMELSHDIGVSSASCLRALRTLGFNGYSEFKREINAWMLEQYNNTLTPAEKHKKTRASLDKSHIITDTMHRAVDNIHKACGDIAPEMVESVAQLLIGSRRKFVAGFRGTSSCATYMARRLTLLLPDVLCCDKAESSALEQVVNAEEGDCLLLYSFPRYSRICKGLINLVHDKGGKVVTVTDKITSSLAPMSDFVIATPVEGIGFMNSYIAPMCVSEILLLAVSAKVGATQEQRASLLDEYLNMYHHY